MPLSDVILDKEWYDNSLVDLMLACKRKAFIARIYNGGLEAGVGYGALFGTCMHGFRATYYSWWGKESEERRRLRGMRKFLELHEELFKGPMLDTLDSKHTKEAGLGMIDHYCDSYLQEDTLLKPIAVELSGAIEIKPRDGDPFDFVPFWYAFKIDGIHQRLSYGDYWVAEMKNTGGGVARELKKLRLSRQPTGYVYCARQFPGPPVSGCMPDVNGVMVKTRECQRDFYPKTQRDTDQWRLETINIVEDWRRIADLIEHRNESDKRLTFEQILSLYYQNTAECTSYGLCAFYDICRDGFSPATLAAFRRNSWNPLEDQTHLERKEIKTAEGLMEIHEVTP